MKNNMTLVLVIFILVVINFSIYNKEMLISNGEIVYIETTPRDPRSIMQGDYHVLRYKFPADLRAKISTLKRSGYLVLKINDKKVGAVLRVFRENEKLEINERIIFYRIRSRRIRVGAEAFFFQEGHGNYYNGARYGELRLAKNGQSLLIALRDKNLKKLAPPKQ